ncbi:unnamed protein product [Cylicocyclus nassatus]|uniref:Uncharacterized protein n=1 Tax=Cylicocyclus nassatus TaxID=53992 RepID=A0AA36H266_CYLNA|nr:unnamed protein product [Cylicocyclus nassatus]
MDLSERKERFVEAVNIRVMEEFVKIVNLPIAMKKNFDLVIEDVLHILEYDKKDDKFPLTWPKPSGFGSTTFAISDAVSPMRLFALFTKNNEEACIDGLLTFLIMKHNKRQKVPSDN